MNEAETTTETAAAGVELAITTGTPDKAGVGTGRKFIITPLGVRFRGKMTYEQWVDLLRFLKTVKTGWDFALADALRYGRKEYGDDKVNEAVVQMEFDTLDLVRGYRIGQIEFDFRSPLLTPEHYYVLGDLTEPDRTRWMAIAENENLTALELKKSIEAGKIVRLEAVERQSGGAGMLNVQSLHVWFGRWTAQAGGEQQILAWEPERKRSWLQEVSPIVELAKKLEATL